MSATAPPASVLKFVSGTNRTLWVEEPVKLPSSSRAVLSLEGAVKVVQLAPLSTENCQSPLVLSAVVMATPLTPPSPKSSRSLAVSSFRKLSTVEPFGSGSSSSMAVKLVFAVNVVPLPEITD